MKSQAFHSQRLGFAITLIAGVCALLGGCSNILPPPKDFGLVKGSSSFRSLNGLAILIKMWEEAGAKCLYPQKLSPKLESMDAIVLVGDTFAPPGTEARKWLEEWLGKKPNRTVIYFGRDYNAEIEYRKATLDSLTPEDKALGELRLAQDEALELNQKLEALSESTFCRWFYLDVDEPRVSSKSFSGPWAEILGNKDLDIPVDWPVGITLYPPSRDFRKQKPSWLTGKNPAAPNNQFKAAPTFADGKRSFEVSNWNEQELDTDAAWNNAFRNLPKTELLLSNDSGRPLAFRLTDNRKYPDSQIIILTNGAPLLNGSIVRPWHQKISAKLIEASMPAERVAMLRYDQSGIMISSAPEKEPMGGLEFLMVWPISAVTMPAALLCILVCAVLWPILGRPRTTPNRSVSDFGLHIDALGKILHDSRDLSYAKNVVSQYFRQVRDEAPPVWLETLGMEAVPPATVDPTITPAATPATPPGTSTASNPPSSNPFADAPSTQPERANAPETNPPPSQPSTSPQSDQDIWHQ